MTLASNPMRAVQTVAPIFESEAQEVEERGEVTERVHRALIESELYWYLLPTAYGGGGQSATSWIEAIEELTRADGSCGWLFMANSGAIGVASGFLPSAGAELLFGGEEKAILAGQNAPMGKAVEDGEGYRVSGRYQFGSGSTYATWFSGGFSVIVDGKPRMNAAGSLDQRVGYFPREAVELQGNWDVSGLVGTGSYDYEIADRSVPPELTFERMTLEPTRPEPIFSLGVMGIAVAGHAGIALGLMKRALQEVAAITKDKKRAGYSVPVGEFPVFLSGFATHDALYRATRGYVLEAFGDAEATIAEGGVPSDVQRARLRQASTFAHDTATRVVDFCRLWGSTQAFRNPSALGRAVRDMGVATQHVLVDPITLVDAGGPIVRDWQQD